MNWIHLISSSLIVPLIELLKEKIDPYENVRKLFIDNAFKVTIIFFTLISIAIIFSAGIILTVTDLTNQYDKVKSIQFTGTTAGSLSLILICLIAIAIGKFYFSPLSNIKKKPQRKQTSLISPNLENALVLLINHYINERELKRNEENISTSQKSTFPRDEMSH